MKLRTLSLVLFAACGKDPNPIIIVDAPDGGGVSFQNSANDMVYISFGSGMSAVVQTPADDVPDNDTALMIPAGSVKVAGNFGIGGDPGDDYVERDTFLINSGANDQLTIRMDWDGGDADLDYFLFEVPPDAEAEPFEVTRGTLINNTRGEFKTVNVDPNTNYWLWAGAFNENAPDDMDPATDDGPNPGGSPEIPHDYDLSIYGATFNPAAVPACTFTEAADGTNDRLYVNGAFDPMASTGMPETGAGQAVTAGAGAVYCGVVNNNFVADSTDGSFGYIDVDTYALNVTIDTDLIVTISGVSTADQDALAALFGMEVRVLNKDGLFFENAFLTNKHGVFTARLPSSAELDDMGVEVGPKSIGIIAYRQTATAAPGPINYKISISADVPNTRAPRLTTPADLTEANDSRQ
jgi:hypothetical protein